ncbi:MAG: hypothetical protein ACRCTP_04390 [Aeromonas popoffii]|uniref:hypothetical protein n=1 Tax=Aeromonas popoffii TaxID=70856 RepID=UPI003F3EFF5F
MEIKNEEKAIFSSGMDGGQAFGVNMGPQLFQVMTSSLYKDKPRAVCRETLANFVDAHRERDFKFEGLEPGSKEYLALLDFGYAVPGTPGEVHIPTEVEPWYEVTDFGIGLPVDKVLGEVQYESSGEIIRDANGHPVRKDGVYTTLFGSDKQLNNRVIGAYGLGCKSPYAISDVFQLISVVNGEEHRYIMFLDSQRSPKVDWLTKDANGEPDPVKTDRKNGVTVRIDAIPMNMKEKIRLSVSEILQTIPAHEQPIINNGMYKFTPMEVEPIYENLDVVVASHYGSMFNGNYLVVNTGGVIYPLASDKMLELIDFNDYEMIKNYNHSRCVIVNMPLGTVNIPPSREEITYDDWSMGNIRAALTPYADKLRGDLENVIEGMPLTPFGMLATVNELSKYLPRESAIEMVRDKIEEQKEEIRKLGFTPVFKDKNLRYYADLPETAVYGPDFRCWTQTQYERVRTLSSHQQVVRDIFRGVESVDVGRFIRKDGVVILNDTKYTKSTVMGRFNKLELGDIQDLFPHTLEGEQRVHSTGDIHTLVICGPDGEITKGMDHYESIAMIYCKAGGFDYTLASDVCERFDRIQKQKAKLNKSISIGELERNVAFLHGDVITKYDGPHDLMTAEDDEKYLWLPEADIQAYINVVRTYSVKKDIEEALNKILGRGTRATLLLVRGVRTASRRAIDANSERFIQLDLKALEEARAPIEIERLKFTAMHPVNMMDRLSIGLDGVYSKILTRTIFGLLDSNEHEGSLFWHLSMFRNFPNKEVLTRFMGMVGTNHHDLITFLADYFKFFGAYGERNYDKRARVGHQKLLGYKRSVKYNRLPRGTHRDTLPEHHHYAKVGAIPPRKEMEILRSLILLKVISGDRNNSALAFPSDMMKERDLEVFLGVGIEKQVDSIVADIKKNFFDKYQTEEAADERSYRSKQIEDVLNRFIKDNYPMGRLEPRSSAQEAINIFNQAIKVIYPDLHISNMDFTA